MLSGAGSSNHACNGVLPSSTGIACSVFHHRTQPGQVAAAGLEEVEVSLVDAFCPGQAGPGCC